MRSFYQILLLLLFLLLGNIGEGYTTPTTAHSTQIGKVEKPDSQSTNPIDQPSLFNIYHQAEHAGNSSTNVPLPLLVVDEHDQSVAYQNAMLCQKLQEQIQFVIFDIPNRKLARLKFIFPFHSFL